MKKILNVFLLLIIGFIIIQFFKPEEIQKGTPMKELSGVPSNVNLILKTSCFDCHSSETNLKWFDEISPGSFLVSSHIREGRKVLDFSKWNDLEQSKRNAILYYSINKILSNEMPISSYTLLHPTAKLSKDQIQILKNYAIKLSSENLPEIKQNVNKEKKENTNIKPSLNGLEYISDYKNWKAISTTDRFDNGTMRIIYGNDIAIKAIENHQTNIWPDGTIFAKAAWKQSVDSLGNITPGNFVQVEFMVKDSKKYSKTKGWAWGRWKGTDLKPYGDTPQFDNECIRCHQPMSSTDYVFTSPIYLINQVKSNIKKNEK